MAGKRQWGGVAVTTVAVAAAVAHVVWPNLEIDTITVVLLVVALLPWLGHLLDSIEMPGGWKVKYRSLEQRQDSVEQVATDATSTAQAAFGAAQVDDSPTMDTVRQMVEEYDRLWALPRQRTGSAEFDRLFGAMVAVVPKVPDFDVDRAFGSPADGARLTAFAYVYGRPDPARLTDVVAAAVEERSPVVQYWAIRTVAVLVEQTDVSAVPEPVVAQLRALLDRLPVDTARHAQLAGVLQARQEALLNPVTR
ncbi:hypothetical protein [Labedaea rhizosphaerae]|uniref:hypothetical protein n=1 Tax=Labedaea rhizosphaerae TaxID=598644 RepID=UPI00105DB53B|nr:hypothetical protein [Labedaea rhizosphaerae]